jgi:RNA polymerase sigma-70 factor (ECF subfamily)
MEIDAALPRVEGSAAVNSKAQESFERLLAANAPALCRLAASYTHTAGDRDDLLQEIAFAIWQALPRFRRECSERTFLFRIAHNRGIARLARTRAHPPIPDESIEATDPGPDPEAELSRSQQTERLHRAVRALPLAHRQVVMLMLEGMGYGEIADVLGISGSNVGARLTRARKMLRESLEGMKCTWTPNWTHGGGTGRRPRRFRRTSPGGSRGNRGG